MSQSHSLHCFCSSLCVPPPPTPTSLVHGHQLVSPDRLISIHPHPVTPTTMHTHAPLCIASSSLVCTGPRRGPLVGPEVDAQGVSRHFPALAAQPLGRFDRLVKKHDRDMDTDLMVRRLLVPAPLAGLGYDRFLL
jgi:hypothetical protein